jgi:hypothetical protein
MQHTRPGRVFTLRLIPPAQQTLLDTPEGHILEAISPGQRATRYGREWIVGQTTHEKEDFGAGSGSLTGRIGFQGESGTAEIWDDDIQDFVPTAIPSGLTAPFAIDLDTLTAAMQPRGSIIKINSLIGAFEALLSADGDRWRVVGLRNPMSLEAWKNSVAKIISVKFTIREPNPHYFDAASLEDLMNDLESEAIQLEARNENGLNANSEFLKQTEGHIGRGYGEGEYKGVRGEGSQAHETVYSTRVGAEEESEEIAVDPTTGEVASADLVGVLAKAKQGENNDTYERRVEVGREAGDPPRELERGDA